ncbi:MAG: sulfatase-like hydrolase/transferase [Planctomycetota bacterium]
MTYADTQIGRLLDVLDDSDYIENTLLVLWGDHGWHLGEKRHWRKFSLWEEATRAPLIWVVPGLTAQDRICKRTVDFTCVFPTLCELTGLGVPAHCDGVSIASLLESPDSKWDRPAVTTYGYQRHAVRSEQYRYIQYADGSGALYDEVADPHEWTNPHFEDGGQRTSEAWAPRSLVIACPAFLGIPTPPAISMPGVDRTCPLPRRYCRCQRGLLESHSETIRSARSF